MSEQQILSRLNEILGARRNLRAQGFVDRTAAFRAEMGQAVLFALCDESPDGMIGFLGINDEEDASHGDCPVHIRVVVRRPEQEESRDFTNTTEERPVLAALLWLQQLGAPLHFDSLAA